MTNHVEADLKGTLQVAWFQKHLDEELGDQYDRVLATTQKHVQENHCERNGERFPRYVTNHLAVCLRKPAEYSQDDRDFLALLRSK